MFMSWYRLSVSLIFFFFFFNDTATTEIYTLSLHDALPICWKHVAQIEPLQGTHDGQITDEVPVPVAQVARSEEHTSELQSQSNLVCRLLLEKKKKTYKQITHHVSHIRDNLPRTILTVTSTN